MSEPRPAAPPPREPRLLQQETSWGRWFTDRQSLARNPLVLFSAFVLAHFWLGFLNLFAPGLPLGDVSIVYKFWADQVVVHHYLVGIDGGWVYPIVALVPMLVARIFGPELYSGSWLSLVLLLDLLALGVLTSWGRNRLMFQVGWWWTLFLVLLGPIALGRIDSISVPIAIIAVLLITRQPRVAIILLTVATWIKVWPAAVLLAMLIALRERVRLVVVALITSIFIIATALVLGSGANVFSFITQQASRGLQIEAPVSTFWLWAAFAHAPQTFVYYDNLLLTWQVKGQGVDLASALMTPLLALVMFAITSLALLSFRRGVSLFHFLPTLVLAYVVAFIAFNKVGSPQFLSWLAVPVILGLVVQARGRGTSFRVPAALTLLLAALTQIIYPYWYGFLLGLNPVMLTVISVRNGLFFVLLAWALIALWRAAIEVPTEFNLEVVEPHGVGWAPAERG